MKLKAKDLRDMTADEVEQKITSLREELFKFRCQARQARVEKPHSISETKRSLARCYTILREKEIHERADAKETGKI